MVRVTRLTALFFISLCSLINVYGQQRKPATPQALDSAYAQHDARYAFRIGRPENQRPDFNSGRRTGGRPLAPRRQKQLVSGIQKRSLNAAAMLAPLSAQATICFDTSERFFVINDTLNFYAFDPYETRDGNLLIPGQAVVNHPPYSTFGFLMKCSRDGDILWTKTYDSIGHRQYHYVNYYKVQELPDGSLLLAGSTWDESRNNDDLIVTRTNHLGDIRWSKVYNSRLWGYGNGSNDFYYVQQMKKDPYEEAAYLCGPHWASGRTLLKLNLADGTLLWSTAYESYVHFDRAFGIDVRRDEIRYFGRTSGTYNSYVNVYRINKKTGAVIETKNFKAVSDAGYRVEFLGNEPLTVLRNGNYALAGSCLGYWQWEWDGKTPLYQAAVMELDSNLNFVRAYCFRNAVESNSYNTRVTVFPDGSGLFTMLKIYTGYTADVYYVQFRNGQIVKQRKKHYRGEGIPIENHALKLQGGGDLIVKLLGDSITNVPKIEFLKLHPSDTSSYCLGIDDHATFIEPFTYEPVAIPLDSVTKDIFQESVNHTLTVGNIDAEKRPACFQVSYCDSLKLLASKRTLCITEPLQLTIRKNAACGSLVPLTYDTDAVDTLSHLNDSTVTIRFSKPWAGYISGSLQGCSLLQDSVYVTVLRAPGRLNLGPDTSLCPANTLVLNARSGYAVYQWQDGSADSLFTVKAPGLYHVKVTDACGGVFYDSVRISPRPPVAISIGPDRFKCNTDTVHLSAPTGFLNYSWSPDYKINTTQAQQVVVNPAADTFYTLKAEKTPGCFAFDTIHVTVRHSPPIQLGPDTSFCAGSSVLLNAGAGFSHYQWSTGSSGPQLLVQAAGTYSITGTTTDGCRSFDTVTVPHVFPLPHVSLDPEPRLCTGSVRMLDAGAFASYRWQDGSTGRKFRAAGAGTYYVSVTDANACTSSDTTRITTVLALPKNFLPADTAICSYGTLELKPLQPYSAYRWSTNSTQPATVISSPGTYWLQATDSNGCTGSDSTIVHLKDCLKGLYVPTAFTPNNDGKNDQMRAQLFGTIVAYEFTIYNRWGQVVFHTTDSTKGWNGQLKNKDQDTGVYVWTCRYQLAGEPEKAEKGSFVLIR